MNEQPSCLNLTSVGIRNTSLYTWQAFLLLISGPHQSFSLLSFFFEIYLLLFVGFCLHAYLCIPCMWCSRRQEEGVELLGTGVTGDCEPPCGRQGSGLGSPKERSVFLLSEPSFQHKDLFQVLIYIVLFSDPSQEILLLWKDNSG